MVLVTTAIFGGNGNGRSWPVVAGQKRPGAAKIDFDNWRGEGTPIIWGIRLFGGLRKTIQQHQLKIEVKD